MRFLFDVNALIALGLDQHQFHSRVESWLASLASNRIPQFATCSITELGFVRVVSQIPTYNVTVEQAKIQLRQLRESTTYDFQFLTDDHDMSHLPAWVKSAKQTTDGHLAQLAKTNGAMLATLDEGIPGVLLIPENK